MSILQRIELNFWHIVIPLIRESSLARFLFAHVYQLGRKRFIAKFLLPASASAITGLMLGFILGLFSQIW